MSNTSKAKGKRGETAVCNMLSECFNLPFMRVFGSGSFFGGKNISKFNNFTKEQQNLNEGDIVVPEELDHLSLEVKNYKDFPFHALFNDECAVLDGWISQASHTNKPFWLLFFKITHKNVYVCYLKEYNFIKTGNVMIYKDKFLIELAKPFLAENKQRILDLKVEQ